MLQVILFALGGGIYALKLSVVERILAPGEPLPAGRRLVDLAALLEIPRPEGGQTEAPHLALLADGGVALSIGRPAGAAEIDPAWILPLPGYMFRGRRAPFRGLIDVPASRRARLATTSLSRPGLLLDEESLAEMTC